MWELFIEFSGYAFTLFMVLWVVVMMHLVSMADDVIDNHREDLSTKWRKSYLRWRTGMFMVGWLATVAAVIKYGAGSM